MTKPAKKTSRELGLEAAMLCGEHFFNLKHLHYGYWTEGLAVDLANLHKAQEDYTRFMISHIPRGVRTILDVGCGAGHLAKELIDRGYAVDCVSPSPFLSGRARELLGEASRIFECPYEGLETDSRYDMVLFSESFQYIGLEEALAKTAGLLNDNGYILICDVFKISVESRGSLGGGHKLSRFYEAISRQSFSPVVNIDITEETAPNLDMLDDAMKKVVGPIIDSSLSFLSGRYPLITKLLRWKYRRRIDKLANKYFGPGRRSEDFKRYKTYRLFLYQKLCAVAAGADTGPVKDRQNVIPAPASASAQ